jgi:hypothetical protein
MMRMFTVKWFYNYWPKEQTEYEYCYWVRGRGKLGERGKRGRRKVNKNIPQRNEGE